MPENSFFPDHTEADSKTSSTNILKWGGFASLVMAVSFIVPFLIYLMGDLRDAMGPFAYSFADFLYGPVWAASLVTSVLALRERIGELAPRRVNLALFGALAAAFAFVAVACIRSANRHYHLIHPELHLEDSTTVLIMWATLVAGVIGTAWHFLGWAMVLIGSAGWTSARLPRLLCALYLTGGATSLFVYVLPDLEGNALVLCVAASIWQGILLLKAKPEESPVSGKNASQPGQA
jgi:hypothetical protein